MNASHSLFALAGLALTAPADAAMYKCVDPSGHVTYSNVAGKGCGKLDTVPAISAPPQSNAVPERPTAAPVFPRVDAATQRVRDDRRRSILESELTAEIQALAAAREKLAEQEGLAGDGERNMTQRCVPAADGTMNCSPVPAGINSAKLDERLEPFRNQVAQHERNIEALNREISRLP